MRHVIVHESLKETEARPPGAFAHLVERSIASAEKLLEHRDRMDILTACPACGSPNLEIGFRKHEYEYLHCTLCQSLWVSPRPTRAQYHWYLHESPAALFRRDPSYVQSIEARMRDVALPRADQIESLLGQVQSRVSIVQVGPRNSMVLEQLHKRGLGPLVCVNPLPPFRPNTGIDVTTHASLAQLPAASARIVAVFDSLEHELDVAGLLTQAQRVLVAGGFLVVTARSGSGFDVQVLWENADVTPLEHLNLISVEGLQTALARSGFEILEFSTPGQLDVQVVERLRKERGAVLPRFLEYLLSHRDALCHEKFQDFIQEQRLSSHLRLIARKSEKL
jgi:transposase-like protein